MLPVRVLGCTWGWRGDTSYRVAGREGRRSEGAREEGRSHRIDTAVQEEGVPAVGRS